MKKIISLVIAIAMMATMSMGVSAHWVDNYVPMQVQATVSSEINRLLGRTYSNDEVIQREAFSVMMAAGYGMAIGVDERPADSLPLGTLYAVPFSDCKTDIPYRWNTLGVMNGVSEGIFGSNSNLLRDQTTALLKRGMAITQSVNGRASYPDVQNNWALEEITWATQNGIVCGFDDGTFRPSESLTYAQALKILWLAMQKFGFVLVNSRPDQGYNNSGNSFSPTPQQGQGYTNPDGGWNSGYNNGEFVHTPGYNNQNNGEFEEINRSNNQNNGEFEEINRSNNPLYGSGLGI